MPVVTDVFIKNLKPRDKIYKTYDAKGLYIETTPKGSKRWRFRYRFGGKEKLLSLGLYPEVSLAEARASRDAQRELLAKGIDPSQQRKLTKTAQAQQVAHSFGELCKLWQKTKAGKLAASSMERDRRMLENNLLPRLGHRPASEITAPELLAVLRHIENRGVIYTAHSARAMAGRVFRFGIAIGWVDRDVAADLRGALTERQSTSRAAVTTPDEFAGLLAQWPVTKAPTRSYAP